LLALKTPVLDSGDVEEKRNEIREYFQTTWAMYESLFEVLKDDSVFYERPEPLRHPLIFYFGHTATFFINKLMVAKIIDERVDANAESMLAIGVDEMSWDDLDDAHYDWPSAETVRKYRNKVKVLLDDLIDNLPLTLPIQWDDPFWIIMMGIEHERIHLETSSVLIRQLPIKLVKQQPNWQRNQKTEEAPKNKLLAVLGGLVKQGREQPSSTYGWDNEYGNVETKVEDFKASQYLVSNHEFLAFVEEKGYQTESYWTEEGWNWLQFTKAKYPYFWNKSKNNYQYRTMLEEIKMPWDWPVDVNFLEAKAFCNWLGQKKKNTLTNRS